MGLDLNRDDIHVDNFVLILETLQPHLPISDAYESVVAQRQQAWWSSQQEHMIRWFGRQNSAGQGTLTRNAPNVSSRTAYNRLSCPAAFVWLAEALGVAPDAVQAAADEALAEPNARRRSGIMRGHFPWDRIAELASDSPKDQDDTDYLLKSPNNAARLQTALDSVQKADRN